MDGSIDTSKVTTTITRKDLAEAVRASALLVNVSISTWSGQIIDKRATQKIKEDAGAKGRVGFFKKYLLTGVEGPLKIVTSAHSAVRTFHYENTLKWDSDARSDGKKGPRLLATAFFNNYAAGIGRLKRVAEEQADAFADQWDDLVKQGLANQGTLANELEFPDKATIRKAFNVAFEFTPIPQSANFSGLPDAMLKKLGSILDKRQQQASELAAKNVWSQIRQRVTHLHERLADTDNVFKFPTLEHVRSLVDFVPAFSVFSDDRMDEVALLIGNMVQGIDAKEIRENEVLRKDIAKQAAKIIQILDEWGV